MKYLIIGVLASVTLPSLFSQSSLQDSLILSLSFTGNTADSSGNQNDAQIFGATFTDDRFGNPASALSLDGVDDYLTVLNNQKLHAPLPVTIAAWVYLDNNGNNMIFRNEWQENYYSGVWMAINGGRISGTFSDGGPVGVQSRRTVKSDVSIPLQTWTHIAAVITGDYTSIIYINGREACVSYEGFGEDLLYYGNDGRIGTGDPFSTPGPLKFYQGKIDELKVYNRILQPHEIAILSEVAPLPVSTTYTSICHGDSVQLSIPEGGYTSVSWTPSVGLSCTDCPNPMATVTQPTTYVAMLEKSPGCVDIIKYQVNTINCCEVGLTSLFGEITTPICQTDSSGSFTIQGVNGMPPYQYSLDYATFSPSGQFDELSHGSYAVWVRDSMGCEFDTAIYLFSPASAITTTLYSTSESSFGKNDGSAKAIPSGGNGGPWSYLWSNGATADSIVGLAPGVYVVTVTDQLGCSRTDSVMVFGASVSLEKEIDADLFSLFPNPTGGKITLNLPHQQSMRVTCLNLLGQELSSWNISPGSDNIELELQVEPGTYFILGETNEQKKTIILSVR